MLSSYVISSKELKNIPISASILHDKEYTNLCTVYKSGINRNKRRAFSERNKDNDIPTAKINKLRSFTKLDI